MPTGEQNKIKVKLGELKDIPEGFRFDSENTWQKLEAKLDSSQSATKKRRSWFYAATVIMILLSAGLFFFSRPGQKRESGQPKSLSLKLTSGKKILNNQVKLNNDAMPPTVNRQHSKQIKNEIVPSSEDEEKPETSGINKPIEDNIVININQADVIKKDSIKATAKVKSKFKIVHINEVSGYESNQNEYEIAYGKTDYLPKKRFWNVTIFEPAAGDEKINNQKKPRTLLSFLGSSQ